MLELGVDVDANLSPVYPGSRGSVMRCGEMG